MRPTTSTTTVRVVNDIDNNNHNVERHQSSSLLSLESSTPAANTKFKDSTMTSVSRRVSCRLQGPSVEYMMSSRGLTLHKLRFPGEIEHEHEQVEGNVHHQGYHQEDDDGGGGGNEDDSTFQEEMTTTSTSVSTMWSSGSGSRTSGSILAKKQQQSETEDVALYGRDIEIKQLHSILEQTVNEGDSSSSCSRFPVVLIAGTSGCGKTSLACKLQKSTLRRGGYYCLGKYNMKDKSRQRQGIGSCGIPFSGLVGAMQSLSWQVRFQSNEKERRRIHDRAIEILQINTTKASVYPLDGETAEDIAIANNTDEHNEEDFMILMELIPGLASILQLESQSTSSLQSKRTSLTQNKTKLHVLFHRFLQVVCTTQTPLVLVLDDLQWADQASFDLVHALIKEKPIPGLVLIGCYRSNEIDNSHRLTQLIESIKEDGRSGSNDHTPGSTSARTYLTEIEIGSLAVADIQDLLAYILQEHYESQAKVDRLASILHTKTAGNVYFVIQFIKRLYNLNILHYNLGNMCWCWDEDAIVERMDVTDNVAEFMQQNLATDLSLAATQVLQIGACLGNEFDESIVAVIVSKLVEETTRMRFHGTEGDDCSTKVDERKLWSDFNLDIVKARVRSSPNSSRELPLPSPSGTETQVKDALSQCVERGFLYKRTIWTTTNDADMPTMYRFVHDNIQEAALRMIPTDQVDLFRFYIGLVLTEDLSSDELDKNLYVAVDFLNRGDEINGVKSSFFCISDAGSSGELLADSGHRRRVLKLNLKAGKHAMTTSAFEKAVDYFDVAIQILMNEENLVSRPWTDDSKLRCLGIELFSMACKAEYCIGNMEGCMKHVDQIVSKTSLSIEDKLHAYTTLVEAYSIQERHTVALNTTLRVLRQIGVRFPPLALLDFATLAGLMKTKAVLRSMDATSIISLPVMNDEVKVMAMKLMSHAVNDAYMTNSKYLVPLILKQVRWSVKHGICDESASAFSQYGVVLVAMGEYHTSAEISRIAETLSRRPEGATKRSRALMQVYGYNLPWTSPAKTCLRSLIVGHEIGMKQGDLVNAFYCAYLYIMLAGLSGRPLHLVTEDIEDFSRQMKIYNQEHIRKMCLPHLQFVMNMMYAGDSIESNSTLSGEIMEFGVLMDHLEETKHVYLQEQVRSLQLYLAYYFDDLSNAWEMAKASANFDVTCLGQACIWRRYFFVGMTAYGLAIKASKGRNRVKVKGHYFSFWMKVGKQSFSKLKQMARRGNVNCIHLYYILEAEKLALQGASPERVLAAFDLAIVTSSRSGYVHDRALSYERAADFLIRLGDKERNLKYYQEQALLSYGDWGAKAKVRQLVSKWNGT